jgi:hypothetical protein
MSALAELTSNPTAMWFMGLSVGLWVAANVWIWRWAVGYQAGVKYCLEALDPLQRELCNAFEGALAPTSELRHHVSEEMRRRMEAAQAQALPDQEGPDKETRH